MAIPVGAYQAAEDSRASRRFAPRFSIAASILNRELKFVHGTVANLSQVGASLLTERRVDHGSYVAVELSLRDQRLLEAVARVVWTYEGVTPDAHGSLVGVSFCRLSADQRIRIRTCASTPDETFEQVAAPCVFDQLSEPGVDWFLARELDGPKAKGSRWRQRRSSSPTPPSIPRLRR
jgi:hypothetical protein